MDYKLESNVPLPTSHSNGPKPVYPFRQMKVGDSFVYPVEKHVSVISGARDMSRELGWRFSTRKIDDRTRRIWRMS